MRLYNLLQYTGNYSMTSEILWDCYRDKIHNFDANDNASDGKSFEYKTKVVGETPEQLGNEGEANRPPLPFLNVEITIPLKYWDLLIYL